MFGRFANRQRHLLTLDRDLAGHLDRVDRLPLFRAALRLKVLRDDLVHGLGAAATNSDSANVRPDL